MTHIADGYRSTATTRRNLLKIGLWGASGLSLSGLLRSRAKAAEVGQVHKQRSVVWLWLQGGAPHIETFDPKMTAPSDYRSMVGAISTALPGVEYGALLPRLAKLAPQLAVVRSFSHTNPDHLGASHYVLTAEDAPIGTKHPSKPSFGSITSKVRGANHPQTGVPTFVRVSRTVSFDFDRPLWLGAAHAPFDITGPARNDLNLCVDATRLGERRRLLQAVDRLKFQFDAGGTAAGLDAFEQQAVDLVLGQASRIFDCTQEDPRLRERYGPGLGEQLLTARRLCEAGCGFVCLNYGWAPVPQETPFAWDMHLGPSQANAPPMPRQLRSIFPMFDRAIATFIEDVAQRGLSEQILLVITGDFGRTPKINQFGGRDHWPALSTLALSGGGLRMGQVVGTSSSKAEQPTSGRVTPKDLMATIFHVLGISADLQYNDFAGRPQYLLPDGARPIAQLI